MTQQQNWDEMNKVEIPAAELLSAMGWTYISAEALEAERESLRQVVLAGRLANKLRTLNPWISEDNIKKAIREITHIQATSLIDANKQLHTLLTYGGTVQQDISDGQGYKGQTVKYIDFDNLDRNEFLFTRQFKVSSGKPPDIIPDIVLLVNGIPLAVIECKSPIIVNPVGKGVEQILRYQELEDRFEGQGVPKLFETVQVVATLCREKACYATVGTPPKFWSDWKKPYPLSMEELQKTYGSVIPSAPTNQDILLYGLFEPNNFLDLVRNFVVFEIEGGRTIKKLARYQQFIAVNEAIQRIRNAQNPEERGGIIWHTQGSGKSLTMVFLAVKLRRLKDYGNPTLVIVTDRTDLDLQITQTFENCGFPNPEHSTRISKLREFLEHPSGKTILTTIQKFQGIPANITQDENIFVMVDEAHRTNYKTLAAKMRAALKNACFIAFTGTPIDNKDRSTFNEFGSYIHKYTIEEAVSDGATVPIYYESRLPDVQVTGSNLDKLFDRVFREYPEEEREEIKRKYATEEAIASAPSVIRQICLDLDEHYRTQIEPNSFKAQLVAVNRDAAVLYKENLDEIMGADRSALIMSTNHNDAKKYKDLAVPKDDQKTVIEEQFKKRGHPLRILIVCDMLLTGFDAPIEQVMYLHKPLRDHNLLQAIARVNRIAEGKNYGLIVDYWGISNELQKALYDVFEQKDIEGALKPKKDEIPRLEFAHQKAMSFFANLADRDDMEAAIRILEPENIRADFDLAFRKLSNLLDDVLPNPEGLRYTRDIRWLDQVRRAIKNRFRDDSLDLSGCGEKVKQLIAEHIHVDQIYQLLEPTSIFAHDFDERIDKLTSPEAKASEMEHALRHEISVKLQENPTFFSSLKQKLEQIIDDRRRQRIDAIQQLKLLRDLVDEVRNVQHVAESLGLDERTFAFFNALKDIKEDPEEVKELSQSVVKTLDNVAVIDWQKKDDIQREMRREVKRLLRSHGLMSDLDEIVSKLIDLAKVHINR